MSNDQRPNPDELLAEQTQADRRQQSGRLKVFFGAAPGVGKTYAMLEEARARAEEGVDVVVGYAEPHIRTETEKLLIGLDLLKSRLVEYRGRTLKEFDLDAALARKPSLLCVDELAHTNAPGLRHEKRWQDVFELLDAGINVYTTLNVQHLESVKDIVERITGVEVRETLPDEVLDRADEIELIDTTPDELTKRLVEGKVYRPDIAERAIRQFFNKGNLTALREMALRRTAERVDAQMQEHRQRAKVRQTWAASERVLVCVGPSPHSAKLVRSARRLASGLRAPWVALFIDTPRTTQLGKAARERIEAHLHLAEQLGAETVTLSGEDFAATVIDYARDRNVTKLVIGKPDTPRWRDRLFGSPVEEVIRQSGDIDVYVIRNTEPAPAISVASRTPNRGSWIGYAIAAAVTLASVSVGLVLRHTIALSEANVLMLLILGVVATAWWSTRRGTFVACVLSVLAFNFFFVEPVYTLHVHDSAYLITFAVLLVTGLVISSLVRTTRVQAELFRRRQLATQALLDFGQELGEVDDPNAIAQVAATRIGKTMNCNCTVMLTHGDALRTAGQHGAAFAEDPKEQAVARWVADHSEQAGTGTATLPNAAGLYLPLVPADRGAIGVVAMRLSTNSSPFASDDRRLVEAMIRQTATTVERAKLVENSREAWQRVQQESLRNTLLSAVSHDLRTPLTAITGSASALCDTSVGLNALAKHELAMNILSESRRMERVIANLLEITRIEAGESTLKIQPVDVGEIVESVVHRLGPRLTGREVRIAIPSALPSVAADPTSLDQVLSNLLENAIDHTPSGSPIEIAAETEGETVKVSVRDRGSGIPEGSEHRVFEKFVRLSDTSDRRGMGLGLAICKAMIEAQDGTIRATNREGGGAEFSFSLPVARKVGAE